MRIIDQGTLNLETKRLSCSRNSPFKWQFFFAQKDPFKLQHQSRCLFLSSPSKEQHQIFHVAFCRNGWSFVWCLMHSVTLAWFDSELKSWTLCGDEYSWTHEARRQVTNHFPSSRDTWKWHSLKSYERKCSNPHSCPRIDPCGIRHVLLWEMKSIVMQNYFIVLSSNMAYVAGVYWQEIKQQLLMKTSLVTAEPLYPLSMFAKAKHPGSFSLSANFNLLSFVWLFFMHNVWNTNLLYTSTDRQQTYATRACAHVVHPQDTVQRQWRDWH